MNREEAFPIRLLSSCPDLPHFSCQKQLNNSSVVNKKPFYHTLKISDFNSRTREGCDSSPAILTDSCGDFNPRTREGCDVFHALIQSCIPQNFNPRTREGCDLTFNPTTYSYTDFNPRTREGCDMASAKLR